MEKVEWGGCVCVTMNVFLYTSLFYGVPTATFVGGGFLVGLSEAVYTPTMGLTWAVMPATAASSFIVGKTKMFYIQILPG